MLRAFALSTGKRLLARPISSNIMSVVGTSSSSSIHRRNDREVVHKLALPVPLVTDKRLCLAPTPPSMVNVRWASGKKDFKIPDPSAIACNMINMLKCVDLAHLKDSPPAAFWVAVAVGGTQVVIPLLELIGGYCDAMTMFQLYLGAMTVAAFGGVKWGLAISKSPTPQPTWETMQWILTPTSIALLALVLPCPLGFLAVAGAQVTSFYLDLQSCAFPPWGNATRLLITLTTVTGLLMALIAYLLFHNREKERKEEGKKDKKGDKGDNNAVAEEEKEKS